jgi:putative SOS response-associated peptidase YedK
MCGRATLATPPEELAETFGLEDVPLLRPHYNLAPSQDMAVVRVLPGHTARRLERLRWGLVPWWADHPKIGARFINARSDTLLASRAFSEAARERRCIVVVDGFYEWQGDKKRKQPFFVRRPDGKPLALAGVWERWKPKGAPKGAPRLETCSVITTDAQPDLARLHDRMPLVLRREDWAAWLDPRSRDPRAVAPLLARHDVELVAYPVSPRVNSPDNDDPSCIEEARPTTLFPL